MPPQKKKSLRSSELEEKEKIGVILDTSVASRITSILGKKQEPDSPEISANKLRQRELTLVLQRLKDAVISSESDEAYIEELHARFMSLDRELFLKFLHGFVPPEETVGLSDTELIKLLPAKLFRARLAGDSTTDAPPPEKRKKRKGK